MPPTYSPWLNPFEKLARFGLLRNRRDLGYAYTGPSIGADVMRGEDWRAYATSRALFEIWSPWDASPWSGYHRPTLFAALDSLPREKIRPGKPIGFDDEFVARPPAWADRHTALILDLPAPESVAWGALLSHRGPHVPVSTFNNWPHVRALIAMWDTLGALLYYSAWRREARIRERVNDLTPPALLLDRRRLGERRGKPNEFDNRYYLLESDLPTPAMLRRAGVERVVYVRPATDPPGPAVAYDEPDDMNRYLHEIAKGIPLLLARAEAGAWRIGDPTPWTPTIRKTPFNTTRAPAFLGFRRAAAGGFGSLVPEPSSGSGG